jgi:hypothetical protein
MAQEIPDRAEWCSFALEFDRKQVPEPMAMDALVDACLASEPRKEMPDVALINLAAIERAEDGRTSIDPPPTPEVDPTGKQSRRTGIHADYAPLVPLAVLNHQRPAVEVDVLDLQGEYLTDTEPAPPGNSHQRPIPDSCRCPIRARAKQ